MTRSLHVIAALTLLALAPSARAQTLFLPTPSGFTASTGVAHLDLPPGPWQPIAQTEGRAAANGGGLSQEPLSTRVYLQIQSKKVGAILVVSANTFPSPNGWAPAKMCSRTNTFWNDHANGWTRNYDCVLVNHTAMRSGSETPSLWKEIHTAVQQFGGIPKQMIYAQFGDAVTANEISVGVYFNPELHGFEISSAAGNDSEWHSGNLKAEKTTFLNQVVEWAKSYRTTVRQALP